MDLATIAQHLDDEERKRMAEGDVDSEEYHKFLKVCYFAYMTLCSRYFYSSLQGENVKLKKCV